MVVVAGMHKMQENAFTDLPIDLKYTLNRKGRGKILVWVKSLSSLIVTCEEIECMSNLAQKAFVLVLKNKISVDEFNPAPGFSFKLKVQ